MNEIWKKFSDSCKAAWEKTKTACEKLWEDFVEEGKAFLVAAIDWVKDLFGNVVKLLEAVVVGLALAIITALFTAIYESVMYGFDKLLALFTKK